MSDQFQENSRVHDLLAVGLGCLALGLLVSIPWNIDASGPDPFYKGPTIFPILVLSMMVLAALPATWRLIKPPAGTSWHLDGAGWPVKTLVVLVLLIAQLCGLVVIGVEISTLLFLIAALYYLGHRTPLKLIVIPLIVTAVLVITFKYLLAVWFPTPLIVDWFWE